MEEFLKEENIALDDINDYDKIIQAFQQLNDFEIQHQMQIHQLEQNIVKNRQKLANEYVKNLKIKEEENQINTMINKINEYNNFLEIENALETSLKEYKLSYSLISIDQNHKIDRITLILPNNESIPSVIKVGNEDTRQNEKILYLYIDFDRNAINRITIQLDEQNERDLTKDDIMRLINEILENARMNKRKEEIDNLCLNGLPLKLLEYYMNMSVSQ